MKPGRPVIEVNFEELKRLQERARQGPLGEEDCQRLQATIQALSYLIELIGEKDTTISRLRALLAKPSTEKTSRVLEQAGLGAAPKSTLSPPPANQKPKPGHGRNGAEAYRGARRITIAHAALKPGDRCPRCLKGKIYQQKEPALRIRVVGQAPIAATVYELERLRCNLCGDVFEAEAPAGVGEKKYDESAAAMIGLLKYGSGVPFYRLEGLEEISASHCPPRRSGRSWRSRRD
jgi:transposase